MLDQFQSRHHRLPSEILVDPLALIALALKRSLAPSWRGIPVHCREIKPKPLSGPATRLGIWLYVDAKNPQDAALQSFDMA